MVKSAAHYAETALDEIKLLKCVSLVCMLYEYGNHFHETAVDEIKLFKCASVVYIMLYIMLYEYDNQRQELVTGAK